MVEVPPRSALSADYGGGGNRTRDGFPAVSLNEATLDYQAALAVVDRIRESRKYSAHFGSRTLLYFIRSDCGPIKIGITDNPLQRMKALQNASSCRLTYIALHASDTQTEAGLHEELAEWRLHGEWFEPAPLVLAMASYYRELGQGYQPIVDAWPDVCEEIAKAA